MIKQVGGDHYRQMPIQPIEFCQVNGLPYCEANVIKYVCRHRSKNGAEDIRKAIHYLELLLDLDYPDEGQDDDGEAFCAISPGLLTRYDLGKSYRPARHE